MKHTSGKISSFLGGQLKGGIKNLTKVDIDKLGENPLVKVFIGNKSNWKGIVDKTIEKGIEDNFLFKFVFNDFSIFYVKDSPFYRIVMGDPRKTDPVNYFWFPFLSTTAQIPAINEEHSDLSCWIFCSVFARFLLDFCLSIIKIFSDVVVRPPALLYNSEAIRYYLTFW